jgi:hypothetical protein
VSAAARASASLILKAALLAVALLSSTLSAAAQQQPPDTVLTPEQRALARLRAMGAAAQPDTARPAADSLRPQGVTVQTPARTAPPRITRDSIMNRILQLPDYTVTEYQGGSVRFNTDSSVLVLRQNAQVSREGNQLVADSSIVYDERLGIACGYGEPVLHGAGMTNPVVSDTVCYDVRRQAGFARGATTRVQEGAEWNVRCDAYFIGDDLYCHDAIFTDCDLPHPHQHYHFRAGNLKVVRGNVMVARDLTLNFADVPVLWLPFMVQSLSRGRRSGILMPRFGINDMVRTNARYSRRIEDVGMYWAISEYMGAELALDWFSDNWTGLRGSLDYNFANRFLRGGLTYRQFWKEEGGREYTIASQNSWQMDERTAINLTANYSTSTAFVQSRSLDPRELNRSIDSYGSVRRRFDWGNLSLGASRKQFLSDNTVNSQLPNLGLSFSPLTLFEALPGEESWYSNATWQGGADLRMDRTDVGAANPSRSAQSRRQLNSSVRSGLNLGRLSLNQTFSFDENERLERALPGDSLPPLPASLEQRGRWSSNLSFQQRLVGTSTFTPGLSLGGEFARNDASEQRTVHAPTRVDFNAALRTDLFGFWPGVGPFERLRHRLSPSISYNYSPEARADSLQSAVFTRGGIQEQNRLSFGVSQTFEAKYRGVEADADASPDAGMPGRPAAGDSAAAEGSGGPRRRQQTQTVTLLSISTDALVYDFVQAREGDGIVTTAISNSVQSDLMRGLQLSFTHDLFRPGEVGEGGAVGQRSFAPHLSRLNASFSLNNQSWLFRILRLGSGDTLPQTGGRVPLQEGESIEGGPPVDRTRSEYGMVGTSRRSPLGAPRGAVGGWNASFNYTLARPRTVALGGENNQMVTANVSFQPTINWSLRWNTGYSFTATEFTDHVLTLTRTLHDWDANFDFIKAQNGNFSFQFRVNLRANPDIKLDYSQSDMAGVDRTIQRR